MKTIIFDFGNVVGFFDHSITLRRLAPHTDMSGADMMKAVYTTQLEDDFESGRISEQEFVAKFKKVCRLRCDDDFLEASVADIFRPNPEVCDVIPKLKPRYRLILGSNTNIVHSRHFARQFADVLAHFDHLVYSHAIGVRKPRAGFFEHCHGLSGCRVDECLFIDDIAANIEGARAVGLQGVVYIPGEDFVGRLRSCGVQI